MKNSFTCLVKTKPVKQKFSCTVILPLTYVVCFMPIICFTRRHGLLKVHCCREKIVFSVKLTGTFKKQFDGLKLLILLQPLTHSTKLSGPIMLTKVGTFWGPIFLICNLILSLRSLFFKMGHLRPLF